MLSERRLLAGALSAIAVGLCLAWATYQPAPVDESYRTDMQENRHLYFKNIRSIHYLRGEVGNGIFVYTPKVRGDSGHFVIRINTYSQEAHLRWVRGNPPGRPTVVRPDSLGYWNPDTAGAQTHWHQGLYAFKHRQRPARVLRDYFELVDLNPVRVSK